MKISIAPIKSNSDLLLHHPIYNCDMKRRKGEHETAILIITNILMQRKILVFYFNRSSYKFRVLNSHYTSKYLVLTSLYVTSYTDVDILCLVESQTIFDPSHPSKKTKAFKLCYEGN